MGSWGGRGLATWDYRLIETDPVPGAIPYPVLSAAEWRCALCGATSEERRIEVDRIIPPSLGGTNDQLNLQALCDDWNRGKYNRDVTRPSSDLRRSRTATVRVAHAVRRETRRGGHASV